MSTIGNTIKIFRKEKGLTLLQLADATALTAGYISQVENEKTSSSIATLRNIARKLGVRVIDFFADEMIEDPTVTAKSQWTRIFLIGWDADVRQLVHNLSNKRMQPFYTIIPPGGTSRESYAHPGEEFGFVIEGILTLKVGEEVYNLKTNSAFYYSSLLPHHWQNEETESCRLVWVNSPPSWKVPNADRARRNKQRGNRALGRNH